MVMARLFMICISMACFGSTRSPLRLQKPSNARSSATAEAKRQHASASIVFAVSVRQRLRQGRMVLVTLELFMTYSTP